MALFQKKDKKRPEQVNHEKLGRAVEAALITDYVQILHSTKRQIWSSFVRGAFTGLGGVIGATLGVALLVYFLHLLGGTPVIGRYLQNAGHTIQQQPKTR